MKEKADLLIINGRIYTAGDKSQIEESMAIREGKILKAGSTSEILKGYNATDTIDLHGNTVFPGFIDAHCHFVGLAKNLQYTDLTNAGSFDEILDRVKAFTSVLPGGWIAGRGWDQNLWRVKQFPDRAELDKLFPGRPVILIRVDGHLVLANETALELAGIGKNHRFKKEEVEVKEGRLTGILSETAADHIRSIIPNPDINSMTLLLERAEKICFSSGLTGVSDAGLDYATVCLIDTLQRQQKIKMIIYAMLDPSPKNISGFIVKGILQTPRLTIRSIKIYADGSLGSRTALLKKPYSDDLSKRGILVTQVDSVRKLCELAMENNYQVNTHAIGDSANRLILDLYASVLKGKNDKRWRIEHAQVVDPSDVPLFGDYSVIPSVQATHATSDMQWAESRLGAERIGSAYAYKALLAQNGWIANGTDFPIEQVSPLLTFYAAVSRQDLKGEPQPGFQMENALTREQALRSITIWAARGNFWENERGSLEEGKSADFVILDRDIMKIPIAEVPSVKVIKTYLKGECVYGK
ncbi:MAG: amidohydrolase [bacterium]